MVSRWESFESDTYDGDKFRIVSHSEGASSIHKAQIVETKELMMNKSISWKMLLRGVALMNKILCKVFVDHRLIGMDVFDGVLECKWVTRKD
jgi:hypothetical protein